MPLFAKATRASRVLNSNAASFLKSQPRPVNWRLDVRADSNDRGMFLTNTFSAPSRYPATRLVSYISAGGLRTLQPGRFADRDARNRQRFIRFALCLLIIWLIFLFIPCT
jgi:hypothetical protein